MQTYQILGWISILLAIISMVMDGEHKISK